MGNIDIVTKHYLEDSRIFADAFNYFIYDGKPVIQPEQLRPLDAVATATPDGETPVQKTRDLLKCLVAMEDDNRAYAILGLEMCIRDRNSGSVAGFTVDINDGGYRLFNVLLERNIRSNKIEQHKKHQRGKDNSSFCYVFIIHCCSTPSTIKATSSVVSCLPVSYTHLPKDAGNFSSD